MASPTSTSPSSVVMTTELEKAATESSTCYTSIAAIFAPAAFHLPFPVSFTLRSDDAV